MSKSKVTIVNDTQDDSSTSYVDSSHPRRATPRRRKEDSSSKFAPVFLSKAYAMFESVSNDSTNSNIACWSDNGDSFLIKNIDLFAEHIIPEYYKHKNFSSFVRQLNFYGFRKVKSDNVRNSNFWEFKHPHFLRGSPELLNQIKRSDHFNNDVKNNNNYSFSKDNGVGSDELRDQIHSLNDRVSYLEGMLQSVLNQGVPSDVADFSDADELDDGDSASFGSGSSSNNSQKRKRGDDSGAVSVDSQEFGSYLIGTGGADLSKQNSLQMLFDVFDTDDAAILDNSSGSSYNVDSFNGDSCSSDISSIDQVPRNGSALHAVESSGSSNSAGVAHSSGCGSVAVPFDGIKDILQCLPNTVQEKFMDIYMLQFLPPHLQDKFLDSLTDKISSQLINYLPKLTSSSPSQGGPLSHTRSVIEAPAAAAVAAPVGDHLPKLSIEHVCEAIRSIQSSLTSGPTSQAASAPCSLLTAAIGSFLISESCNS